MYVHKNIVEYYKLQCARTRWSRMVEKSLALEIEGIAPKPSMNDSNDDDERPYDSHREPFGDIHSHSL